MAVDKASIRRGRPTLYNGVRMRSRLEADFAAYLDQIAGHWRYEPECFAGQSGQWLPDFGWTHTLAGDLATFTELKPSAPVEKLIARDHDGYLAHVDALLGQMEVAWASRPEVTLELVFWHYGGTTYRRVWSPSAGHPWQVQMAGDHPGLLWPGMGQYARACRGAQAVSS